MPLTRPFRFGGGAPATASATKFAEQARRLEALGYNTLLMPDHFQREWFAAGPALPTAAGATTTLRVGTTLYCNNFRHPSAPRPRGGYR